MKQVYIIGASGFAAEVTEYLKEDKGYEVLGYFDLQVDDYKHVKRWAQKIAERPAVKRAVDLALTPID